MKIFIKFVVKTKKVLESSKFERVNVWLMAINQFIMP